MKNIHVLPTDKPSRLFELSSNLHLHTELCFYYKRSRNIYITSDEEIKEGWHFNNEMGVNKPVYVKDEDVKPLKKIYGNPNHLQKIIITDNSDLIKNGVQAIHDEFLEWFVKNPSCESVEVNFFNNQCMGECGICDNSCGNYYKIIIPKKEPFKHKVESLSKEEVLSNRSNAYEFIDFDKQETLEELKKWKEEALIAHEINQKVIEKLIAEKKIMYSEEDMIKASKYGYNFHKTTQFPEQEFEDSCIRNTQQWLTTLKTNKTCK